MAPVRSYTNWNSRTTDHEAQIEPYRKYFFICEGANTETWYFRRLIDIRKSLNIHPLIDIRLLEKTESDRDISYPKKLIAFAEKQKDNQDIAFDKERDKMIIVFDADIFEEKVQDYDELITAGEKDNILAVTNPAFELFLLLHFENAYEQDILPNEEAIIKNEKEGNQTFIYKLLLQRTGINSKKNSQISKLAEKVETAILQEKKINQDIHCCQGKITCNIGAVIESIRNDDGK
ncbi:RloB family protein [Faecalicatena contorta]|uniref:RloB-like protein n=1 Tax=Faecalicatena contorta TaxID=39482 RepID=A0A315ZQK1_9FIRM|nr:RloB family protein [Faecalicatena contorta]PWJ47806.1 RloB-like protein [Faecalicatena contorta]SUQ15800.1 RloB-like protein [Faecalicatena contorta]